MGRVAALQEHGLCAPFRLPSKQVRAASDAHMMPYYHQRPRPRAASNLCGGVSECLEHVAARIRGAAEDIARNTRCSHIQWAKYQHMEGNNKTSSHEASMRRDPLIIHLSAPPLFPKSTRIKSFFIEMHLLVLEDKAAKECSAARASVHELVLFENLSPKARDT